MELQSNIKKQNHTTSKLKNSLKILIQKLINIETQNPRTNKAERERQRQRQRRKEHNILCQSSALVVILFIAGYVTSNKFDSK